jgi:hypothetical protein
METLLVRFHCSLKFLHGVGDMHQMLQMHTRSDNRLKQTIPYRVANAALTVSGSWREAIMKSFVIGALVAAVGVLGYLYCRTCWCVEIKKN